MLLNLHTTFSNPPTTVCKHVIHSNIYTYEWILFIPLEPTGIPVLISAVSVPSQRLDFVVYSQIKFLLIVKPGGLGFQKNWSKTLKTSISFSLQQHSLTDQNVKGAIHSLDSSCWDYGSYNQTWTKWWHWNHCLLLCRSQWLKEDLRFWKILTLGNLAEWENHSQ